ncbi:hypothetical protein BS47DRAFT_1394708 [Hydnum rufescens UP504]|uniref:Uncharacterized protein n=1 Tax=Hydnum rufescens UP504 TaxID=1448309 RepID=A0A9P6ATX5_9AGAM|nr:hypothetical protein BS47DRAFT_1394708 [Hydnum rufescens UP504]
MLVVWCILADIHLHQFGLMGEYVLSSFLGVHFIPSSDDLLQLSVISCPDSSLPEAHPAPRPPDQHSDSPSSTLAPPSHRVHPLDQPHSTPTRDTTTSTSSHAQVYLISTDATRHLRGPTYTTDSPIAPPPWFTLYQHGGTLTHDSHSLLYLNTRRHATFPTLALLAAAPPHSPPHSYSPLRTHFYAQLSTQRLPRNADSVV